MNPIKLNANKVHAKQTSKSLVRMWKLSSPLIFITWNKLVISFISLLVWIENNWKMCDQIKKFVHKCDDNFE